MSKDFEVELEAAPCPCGANEARSETQFRATDRLHGLPGEFAIVKCRACQLLRTDPRPTAQTISRYYPDNYAPHIPTTNQRVGPRRTGLRAWLSDAHNRDVPPIEPGRLLEIGCSHGDYLEQMRDLGWEVQGLEPSRIAAKYARERGLDVLQGNLENASFPEEYYDLIAGWMVFEHLYDPVSTLMMLNNYCKPGGWLALSLPDAGSVEFRLFKDRWYALQVPTHVYHYTPATLSRLLMATGWKPVKFTWHHNPMNLLRSLEYLFTDRGNTRLAGFVRAIGEQRRLRIVFLILAKLLGYARQSGRMTVWAMKAN